MTARTDCPPDFPLGVYETLAAVATALADADSDYAVGGAVAMFAAGYARTTTDVDVFVVGDQAQEVLQVLAAAGFRIREISDCQFHAQLANYAGTTICADILLTWSNPELSAVLAPIAGQIGAVRFQAFAVADIVASKVTVDAGSAVWFKSKQDIGALYQRGLFDPAQVRKGMIANSVPYLQEFDAMMAEITSLRPDSGWKRR